MMSKRMIINTPASHILGGVVEYYNTIKSSFNDQVYFFEIGSRGEKKAFSKFIRIIQDYIQFYKVIRGNKNWSVLLNPSFDLKSIIRDGIFLSISKRNNRKVIVFIHGWDERFYSRLGNLKKMFFILVYNQADAMIVLAKEFRDRMIKTGIKCQIFLESTVVDDSYFKYPLVDSIRKIEDPFKILFLSRIEKAKGIYPTIDAYQILKRKYPFVTLTVAGDGTEYEKAFRYVSDKKIIDVNFTGYVRGDFKQKVFFDSDCYIFPTYHGEGMPTSVLEAMAAGIPAITRPVGGLKDFFEDGKMGFLTQSLDPKVYAQYIERMINNPQLCQKIGRYNREYAKKRFAASQVVKRLENIFSIVCRQ
jgi:glycosyltransferase involved in cell wall biosynthesis